MVEYDLAMVGVAGSSPVRRSQWPEWAMTTMPRTTCPHGEMTSPQYLRYGSATAGVLSVEW